MIKQLPSQKKLEEPPEYVKSPRPQRQRRKSQRFGDYVMITYLMPEAQEPTTWQDAVNSEYKQEWSDAMKAELASFSASNTSTLPICNICTGTSIGYRLFAVLSIRGFAYSLFFNCAIVSLFVGIGSAYSRLTSRLLRRSERATACPEWQPLHTLQSDVLVAANLDKPTPLTSSIGLYATKSRVSTRSECVIVVKNTIILKSNEPSLAANSRNSDRNHFSIVIRSPNRVRAMALYTKSSLAANCLDKYDNRDLALIQLAYNEVRECERETRTNTHSARQDPTDKAAENAPSERQSTLLPLEERKKKIFELMDTEGCSEDELVAVRELIEHNPYVFGLDGEPLPISNIIKCSITTTSEKLFAPKHYRYPPKIKEQMQKEIDKLLKGDIIVKSTTPWLSPLWIVPKKTVDQSGNKKWRLVTDFRQLNEMTEGYCHPIPLTVDILERLASANYISCIDLRSGFHQIAMDEDSAYKTGFAGPDGVYQYKRMGMGLKCAPGIFFQSHESRPCRITGHRTGNLLR
ncbi:unnamed protein product [Trichogramma brassicae]|uniref:Reverse transcriptase domain-containing protein n=1 Tax=Trichogramma brassicae TaxID=86971 RepID=A0A6H5J1L5_9HYME|nr:unnamed protein product [Trichogramma brassicae]